MGIGPQPVFSLFKRKNDTTLVTENHTVCIYFHHYLYILFIFQTEQKYNMLYVAETWQCSLYRFHTLIRMPPCRLCNIKWHICTWFHVRMRDHFKDKGFCSDLLPCVTVNLHCQRDWISHQLGHLGCGVSVGLFPEKLSKGGKIHPECGWHHPIGWRKQAEHRHASLW